MSILRKVLIAGALALGSLTTANAAPLSAPLNVETHSDVIKARMVCDGRHCERVDRGRDRDRRDSGWRDRDRDRDRRHADRARDRDWRRDWREDRPRYYNEPRHHRRYDTRIYIAPPRYYVPPRPIYVDPYPVYVQPRRVIVRRSYDAHVRWCLARYGSYNPRTDRFLAYDGRYKVCQSPYR